MPERYNPFAINVFGYEEDEVIALRISKRENVPLINLLLLNDEDNHHYCWLVSSQKDKNKHKLHRCLNSFYTVDSLKNHKEYCANPDFVKVVLPKKEDTISFKNFNKSMRHSAVIYADFECFTEDISTCCPSDKKSYTIQYQKHTPSGFCLKLVCADAIDYPQDPIMFTKTEEDDDVVQMFIDSVEEQVTFFYKKFTFEKKDDIWQKRKEII